MLDKLDRILTWIAYSLCSLGGLGLAFAVLATCWNALGKLSRRFLNWLLGPGQIPDALGWIRPLSGEDEVIAFAVGFTVFAALPILTLKKGHITINLMQPLYSPRFNQFLTLIGDVLMLGIAYMFVRQQWNLIFKPARTSRGQEPLLDLIWAGDWAQIWDKRFLDDRQTQVMGLKFWPWHIYAEICSFIFFMMALYVVIKTLADISGFGRTAAEALS